MSYNLFGERLRALRKRAGLTQQAVAERLSIHRTAYTKYETSGVMPDPVGLMVLADLFGVSVDYLVGHDRAEEPQVAADGRVSMSLSLEEQQLVHMYRQLTLQEQQILVQQVQKSFKNRRKR